MRTRLGFCENLGLEEGLRRLRAAFAGNGDGRAARFERQCEIVERYDVAGESRDSICASMGISQRLFYLERRKLLAEIAKLHDRGHQAKPATVEASIAAACFYATDLLYQVSAHDEARARLEDIARTARDENVKVTALCRLVEVEGIAGRVAAAAHAMGCAREHARLADQELSSRTRGELLAAQGRWAALLHETLLLERTVSELETLAMREQRDPHLWALAGRTYWGAGAYRYISLDIAGAAEMCHRSTAAFARAGNPRPIDRVRLLSFRALLDNYDASRAHLARSENARAYALAIEHGIVESAKQALYNTLGFAVYCDEALRTASGARFAAEIATSAEALAATMNDAVLASLAAAARGRFADAIVSLRKASGDHPVGTPERLVLVNYHARLLFKARRFDEAVRAARAAASEWEGSGLHGEGASLRILAEALEALGERRSAIAAASDALAVLQRISPVHHLLAAYRCLQRLNPRRTYRERIEELSEFTRRTESVEYPVGAKLQTSPVIFAAQLTPREREIALLVVEGRTNSAIALTLGISPKTVANHVATIFERLGLRARWQLSREMVAG